MEDKSLSNSINKQYSKYGSLRMSNSEDPMKFLKRIDSSIKDAKEKVQKSIDSSKIGEDEDLSYDRQAGIPMVKLESKKNKE